MNERIRELWRDCVLKHTKDPMNWQTVADEFAELIVRECSKISEEDAVGDDPACCTNTAYRIARKIKKHFGVEE